MQTELTVDGIREFESKIQEFTHKVEEKGEKSIECEKVDGKVDEKIEEKV